MRSSLPSPRHAGSLGSCLLLACLPLLLVACGGDDGGGTAPPADLIPPSLVTDLRATAAAAGEVTLAWTAPGDDGAAGTAAVYDLRRSAWQERDRSWEAWQPVPGLPAPAAAGAAESFTVAGLTEGGVYVFRLRTRDEALWSDPGNVAVATASPALDTTPPAAPDDLSLWAADRTRVVLAWKGVAEDGPYGGPVARYEIRWAEAPVTEQSWDSATPAPAPSPGPPGERVKTTITGLEPERTYHFAVRALDERDNASPLSGSLAAATVRFRTWHVRPDGTGDAPTIQAACVDSATSGDLVLLAPGRYRWSSQVSGTPDWAMIFLPRDSTGFTLRGEAGAAATIIDGEDRGRLLFIQGITPGSTSNLTVEGVTFTGGNAYGLGAGMNIGGAVVGHLSSPVFRDCVFSRNRAASGGAFWFGGFGSLRLERCVFTQNRADTTSGALELINSRARHTLESCDFLENRAGIGGGAVGAGSVNFALRNCLLAGNIAGQLGGALIYSEVHPSEIVGCTFVRNEAPLGSAIRGRANLAADLVVTGSILALGRGATTINLSAAELSLGCSLLHGNGGGDALPAGVLDLGDNRLQDPLFCDPGGHDWRLRSTSPCLPENRGGDACGLMGARGSGCPG